MEQILLAYGRPKETVAAIMMLYKNMKVKDTLAPYLFIICQDYVLRMSIDKMIDSFLADKGKKQKMPRINNYRHGLHQ